MKLLINILIISTNILTMIKLLNSGYIKVRNYLPNNENVINYIASMARISYGTTEKQPYEDDKKLVNFMYKNSHTSPFEKVVIIFEIKCPIFVARHWMRHRTGSFNELSARYTTVKPDFYIPTEEYFNKLNIKISYEEFVKTLKLTYDNCFETYNKLCEQNVPKELSRSILPVGTYTIFYWKTDLHNLFHFLDLRSSPEAQYEIRVYADAIKELLSNLGSDWKDLMEIKN
jgi:thymidylate synthase (FAD)